ncbi:putative palmitoyl-protein thioesterase [Trypoxylus dichotomus]
MISQLRIAVLFLVHCSFNLAKSKDNVTHTPIVLWHGMGDSCCFPFSLGGFSEDLAQALPGVYILSLKIGDSITKDVENGFFLHPNKQVEIACDIVTKDPHLSNGFNAIGFSQGSQFLRALVQRCKSAKVKNLISLGGQHQGVYGLPNCPSLSHYTCDALRKLLNHAAYYSWIQNSLVQATYWHDPVHEYDYMRGNRLLALENFVMVKFENDTMVQPIASEWFGFYKPGQSEEIIPLNKSAIYINDRLGLRRMDSQRKLHFLAVPGNHLQFEWNWFKENIVEKFL